MSELKRAVAYLRVSTDKQANKDVDPEGYSIPAQREACQRKAESVGAEIVDEYIDRGESARSADRPALQLMLARLRELADIDYVVVHKVDRLARSREDDVTITLAIRQSGARLVSATENVDETPSGKLLHGIMATIAEFYSGNLATECLKGMTQKAKKGGTPGMAPVGYLNTRQVVDGREVRTVVIDPERAPHVRWAFEAYASSEWTMQTLTEELARRGLRSRAVGKRPSVPVHKSRVNHMLSNPYYIGVVSFRDVEYEGRHEPLISRELFDRVQTVLADHATAGEKRRVHHHYLKGTVWCGSCGCRLCITLAKGRGGQYLYFFCSGRQRRNGCQQKAVTVEWVEAQLATYYQRIQLSPETVTNVRIELGGQLARERAEAERQVVDQEKRVVVLDQERQKLLQAYYADALPIDLFRAEQARITREKAEAERILERNRLEFTALEDAITQAVELAGNCHQDYLEAEPMIRRRFNQAFFERVWVTDQGVSAVALTKPFQALVDAGLGG
ncbi:MAG: recombinase family protein, partial [Actinomycetota bacterium]